MSENGMKKLKKFGFKLDGIEANTPLGQQGTQPNIKQV